ncbi:MAG: transketolase C-terminal domain-containing protein [Fidelibacterota bacterium]
MKKKKKKDGKRKQAPQYLEVLGKVAIELAEADDRVCAITAAMAEGTGLVEFSRRFPERFFDVGIAEGHAVTFSGGLVAAGMRPITAIYSTFLQRAFDHLIHDVALQNLPVIFALDRAGVVGEDGPTHHGSFDLSYLSLIPNMIVSAPKNGDEMRNLLHTALNQDKFPFAIRYPKDSCTSFNPGREPEILPVGSWEIIEHGKDLVILAVGSMVEFCEYACEILLNEGIKPGLVNCRFVKPIPEETLLDMCNRYDHILTVEENSLMGGFGSQVVSFLTSRKINSDRVVSLGISDNFVEHGARYLLLDMLGLSPDKIASKVREILEGRAAIVRKGKMAGKVKKGF